jgi:hypothetical protein
MKEKTPKRRRKKIRWQASPSPSVAGYRLHWAVGGGVTYDSDSIEIRGRTELILPDDVPLFPDAGGEVELGLTAVSHTGNESDMIKLTVYLDHDSQDRPELFLRPGTEGLDAPLNAPILIDDLNHWVIKDVSDLLPGDPHNYYVDTHHIDEALLRDRLCGREWRREYA